MNYKTPVQISLVATLTLITFNFFTMANADTNSSLFNRMKARFAAANKLSFETLSSRKMTCLIVKNDRRGSIGTFDVEFSILDKTPLVIMDNKQEKIVSELIEMNDGHLSIFKTKLAKNYIISDLYRQTEDGLVTIEVALSYLRFPLLNPSGIIITKTMGETEDKIKQQTGLNISSTVYGYAECR